MEINSKIVRFFSCLSDETRLKILLSLSDKPKSVNEIHEAVGKKKVTLSAISHQLKTLSDLEIIIPEKIGRTKIFRRSNDFCWCILKDAFNHYDKNNKNKLLDKF